MPLDAARNTPPKDTASNIPQDSAKNLPPFQDATKNLSPSINLTASSFKKCKLSKDAKPKGKPKDGILLDLN